MHRSSRFVFAFAVASAAHLVAGVASAQTAGTATVAQNPGQIAPLRLLNGVPQNPRPLNLNPTGVNYSDCIQDMTLQFSVLVSGFGIGSTQNLEVWATASGDCTTTTGRGIGQIPLCWLVSGGTPSLVQTTSSAELYNVRVQDLVGSENTVPPAGTFAHRDATACSQQASFAGVSLTIYFVPVDPQGNLAGTAYSYALTADLVGPPAPTGSDPTTGGPTISDGDTLMKVNWTPNIDSDTAGYDVYIDPIPGQGTATDSSTTNTSVPTLVCSDTGTTVVVTTADATTAAFVDASQGLPEASFDATTMDGMSDVVATSSDASQGTAEASFDDAPFDAAPTPVLTIVDGGCHLENRGGTGSLLGAGGSTCGSTILARGVVQDSGTVTTTQTVDDAGNAIEGGTVVTPGGGISMIPSANLVGINTGSGETVSDKSIASYTITGLLNGPNHVYNVVVAAVDGSGNIGPPSIEACDYPAPVNDFWKLYKEGGGQAGGSFCALEVIGQPVGLPIVALTFGAAAFATARRRRKDRR
jgi:hypothetical protein